MEARDHGQGGHRSSRPSMKHSNSAPLPRSDWPRTSKPRPRPSPRLRRHEDIEDSESSSSSSPAVPKPKLKTRQTPVSTPSTTTTASTDTTGTGTTASTKTPSRPTPRRTASMRVPNAPVAPAMARSHTINHQRPPVFVYEEHDEEDETGSENEVEEYVVNGTRSRAQSVYEGASRPQSRFGDRSRPQSRFEDRSRPTSRPQSHYGERSRPQSHYGERSRPQSHYGERSRAQSQYGDRSRPPSPYGERSRSHSRFGDRARSHSRPADSRRDLSPRSAHHPFRSTPVSRRSPRTSASDSDDDTEVTLSSEDERAIRPVGKELDKRSMHERLNRNQEMTYDDDAAGKASRYAPSHAGDRRAPSRQSSYKQDQYRRPREEDDYRPHDMPEEDRSRPRSKRSSKKYYDPGGFETKPSSSARRPQHVANAHLSSSHSLGSEGKRSAFFGNSAMQPYPAKSRGVPCDECNKDYFTEEETAYLKCGHRICHPCLKEMFTLSIYDSSKMPPTCCTTEHISLKHVEDLFDPKFKMIWNQKYAEHSTRTRTYCSKRGCNAWIRPEDTWLEDGRTVGQCSRCRTQVCCACNGPNHSSRRCPVDDRSRRSVDHGRHEGLQRCHRCKKVSNLTETKHGCNHMTCPCGAEFCMTCGAKWQTCDCPWFGPYEKVRPEPITIPSGNPFAAGAYDHGPPSPPQRRDSGLVPPTSPVPRPRPSSWEEEMMLNKLQEKREQQEKRDENLARRLRGYTASEARVPDDSYGRSREHPMFERVTPHKFVDEGFRRPETVVVPSAPAPAPRHTIPHPPRSTFERPTFEPRDFERPSSGLEYGSGADLFSGARFHSPERWNRAPSPDRGRHPADKWHAPPFGERTHHSPERGRWKARSRHPSLEKLRAPSAHTSRHRSRHPSLERLERFGAPAPEAIGYYSRPASLDRDRARSRPPTRAPSRAPSPPRMSRAPSLHRAPSPDRRRLPSPDRPRARSPPQRRRTTTSVERQKRLAGRFNQDSRQASHLGPIPGHMSGHATPMAVMSPVSTLSPVMLPAVPPPPASHAATLPVGPTHHSHHMPVAPIPPPAASTVRRPQHVMEDDFYGSNWSARSSERMFSTGRHPQYDYHPHHPHHYPPPDMMGGPPPGFGGFPHAPTVKRRAPQAHREHTKLDREPPKPSVLAGLGGPGRGMNRVFEWRNWVEPGVPPSEPEMEHSVA